MNKTLASVCAALFCVALSSTANADCEGGADEGIQRAAKARQAEEDDPRGAVKLYDSALECGANPVMHYFRAALLERLKRFLDARTSFEKACSFELPPDASESWKKHAKMACARRADVDTRIPRLSWDVRGAEAVEVLVDGKHVDRQPFELDPGEHRIEAQSGDKRASQRITLTEGSRELVVLDLSEDAAPPAADTTGDSPWATLTLVGYSVAGAGAVIWIVAGGVFLARKSDLEKACVMPEQCAETELIADTKTAGNASTAGLILFGVGAALGTAFVIIDVTSASGDEVAVDVGPASASVTWTF